MYFLISPRTIMTYHLLPFLETPRNLEPRWLLVCKKIDLFLLSTSIASISLIDCSWISKFYLHSSIFCSCLLMKYMGRLTWGRHVSLSAGIEGGVATTGMLPALSFGCIIDVVTIICWFWLFCMFEHIIPLSWCYCYDDCAIKKL